jgi:RHS repeat-associated protein
MTIDGTNFGGTQGSSTISVGGIQATASVWTATSIQVPVPSGATTGDVLVTVNTVPSNPSTFVFNPTNGIVTAFRYDNKGQLISTTDPLNHTTSFTYTSGGPAPAGLVQTISDALNNVTNFQYDTAGNKIAAIDAAQNTTSFAYDAMNRLKTVTLADNSTTRFDYDNRGRKITITDGNGKVTSYTYDDADRITAVTDANQGVTQYSYDGENNLIGLTDPLQRQTQFAYDDQGRTLRTIFPSGSIETYSYDPVGNLLSKTDRKAQSINYSYDALNRLVLKHFPDGTGVSYAYDLANELTQIADSTGTYGFSYDQLGRLIATTTQYSFLPATTFMNSYGYDVASNRTSLALPDTATNIYEYDNVNRLTKMTDSLAGQVSFGYDALSRRKSLNRPNGVSTNYGYDSVSRLTSVLHQTGTTTADGASYTYDNAGNRTGRSNALNNTVEQYAYDPLYQLTQAVQGATISESYSFDAVGNRLFSLGVSSYNYNSSNELTSTSAASFTYDNNGNTLSRTDATGTRNYSWDFENRLTSVLLPGTDGTVTFQYDPFGRRIQKTFTHNSTTMVTNYLYDGANVIQELDANGSELARYAQGPGIDEPLTEFRSGTTSFYEQDGLGSVTSLSDATGALASTYVYDAFGNLTASTGTLKNPFQYTGREYDSETGLTYYRARYYDPFIGRFINEDPAELRGGQNNFYAYVWNSPLGFKDPNGKQGVPGVGIAIDISIWLGTHLVPGGFRYYGNWGGPGWTGGQTVPYEDLSPQQQAKLAPPIDDQDACYEEHDLCYSRARVRNHCTAKDRPTPNQARAERDETRACEFTLQQCLHVVNGSSNRNGYSRVAEPWFSLHELAPLWVP